MMKTREHCLHWHLTVLSAVITLSISEYLQLGCTVLESPGIDQEPIFCERFTCHIASLAKLITPLASVSPVLECWSQTRLFPRQDCSGWLGHMATFHTTIFFSLAVLHSAHSQGAPSSSSVVYYGYTRYTGFSDGSSILEAGSGTNLSMRFRSCRVGGVLLEATGSSGEYFSVGITRNQQLLVEFRTQGGGRVTQV